MRIFIKEVEKENGEIEVVEMGALCDVQASALINSGFTEKVDKKKKK